MLIYIYEDKPAKTEKYDGVEEKLGITEGISFS